MTVRDLENGNGEDPEDDQPRDDAALVTDAEVTCPFCGVAVEIRLDPSGGAAQEYVEDCEVCCRPWRVIVRYDETGSVEIEVEPEH